MRLSGSAPTATLEGGPGTISTEVEPTREPAVAVTMAVPGLGPEVRVVTATP